MDQPYVTRFDEPGAVVLAPNGEFDIGTVDILREELHDVLEKNTHVVLDLSGVGFLDSLALGSIVSAAKKARDAGGWLRLVAPSTPVRRALRITQIDTVLGLYDTVAQAIAHSDDTAAGNPV